MILYVLIFLLVWSLLLFYLLRRYHFEPKNYALVTLPLTLFLLLFIVTFPHGAVSPGWVLRGHVVTSFLAYAAFALAFCAALFYLLQERLLKRKVLFANIPSLEVLEDISFKLVLLGLPFLTAGVASGAIWSRIAHGYWLSFHPKEIWSLLTLVIYASYVYLHQRGKLSRHKLIYYLIAATLLVMILYLGVPIFS